MLEVDVVQVPGGRHTHRIEKSTVVVGRSAKCDVVVRDPDVSRRHLTIELVDGVIWAEDMGSSNGSTLDNEPLAERSQVAEGQVLRVCDHEIRVRVISSSDAADATGATAALAAAAATSHLTAATMAQGHPANAGISATTPHVQLPPLAAPAHGRVEVPEDAPQQARSFECRDMLWQNYEHMASEAGVSVDELLNDAMALYGRRRVYASAGSANQPQTSLQFDVKPPHQLLLSDLLPKKEAS